MSRGGLVEVQVQGLTGSQKKPRWVLIRWQASCKWSELGFFNGHWRLVRSSPCWWHPGITVRPSRASAYVIFWSTGRRPGRLGNLSHELLPGFWRSVENGGLRTRMLPLFKGQRSRTSGPSGCFMSDSRGKNSHETVAIFSGGFRTLGRKHRAVLDFRGRDRWLILGNKSIDVTFFRQDSASRR